MVSIPGLDGLKSINWGIIFSGIGLIFFAIFVFLILGVGFAYVYWKRKTKAEYSKKIFWFEEVHDQTIPIDEDMAKELVIPGTAIAVFYIKKKDMYLPRLVRKMGKDSYWMAIRKNRELVNFTIKNINKEMNEAGLDYDHTDQRYAWVNLREMIKRNYRDKSVVWWKEYKDVIATAIFIIIITFAIFFLTWRMGILIDRIDGLLARSESIYQAAQQGFGSGVTPA